MLTILLMFQSEFSCSKCQNMVQYKKETSLGQIKPVRTLEIRMELELAYLSKVP